MKFEWINEWLNGGNGGSYFTYVIFLLAFITIVFGTLYVVNTIVNKLFKGQGD